MLGDKTIVDTAQVNADASATNGASVAFGYAYDNGETQTIETLTPTKTLVSAGNKQYEFTGWEVTYYTDAVSGSDVSEGVNNVFGALQNESNMGTQVHDIGESIVLSTHVKLVAQWKEVDYYVGKPISIQVYLDGQPVALSEDTPIGTYLDVEKDTGTLSWDFAEYKDGKAFYDYTYKDNACADIIFKLNSNYLLEGISADLAYGKSGSKGINKKAEHEISLDNVNDDSTVTVYFSTPYTVKYVLDDKDYQADTQKYAVGAGLTEQKLTSDGKGKVTYLFDSIVDTISLAGLTTSENKKIDGWYLEPEYKTEKKTGQTKLTDVKGNAVDKVITFYGRTETPGVAVSKAITSVERNGQSLDAVPETLQVGDIVT